MLSASLQLTTARSGTLVNSAILRRSASGRARSDRQSRMSGWMPMDRSSFTECCVGLVFSSPAAPMYGTSVRCMKIERCSPSSIRICRMVSRNGSDSMSPTVPPISTRHTSASPAPRRMRDLISSVMCGMTWTVSPRYSPRRSLVRTSE